MKSLFFARIIVFSSLFAGCSTISDKTVKNNSNATARSEKKTSAPANSEPITIAAAGDIMLGSPFPNATRMPPNDGVDSLKPVTPIFSAADIAFANLEGPLADGGVSAKCGDNKTTCFAFRMPTHYAKYLKDAGLDVMSVANNHAGDFGDAGRTSTRKALDENGVKHAGSDKEKFSTAFVEAKGKTVAFIGFGHNNIVPNINEVDNAVKLVEQADKEADIVVVSFHGGAEGSDNQRVPNKTEFYFGEARGNLPVFAKAVIDAGADLVLGHGPHVIRGMEIYKDRLIAYSLGNFATYGWFQLAGATAETMVLEVNIDADGKFLGGKINPFVLQGRGILTPDKSNSATRTVKRLSQMDFPQTTPKISEDGTLLR